MPLSSVVTRHLESVDGRGSWVEIDQFFHQTDAHIAAGRLRAEGVPVNLVGINHASANWLLAIALGGIRLQVPLQHVDTAREIMTSEPIAEEADPDRCSSCGSENTTTNTVSWKLALLGIHLFGIPLPWRRDRRRCEDCGTVWREQ